MIGVFFVSCRPSMRFVVGEYRRREDVRCTGTVPRTAKLEKTSWNWPFLRYAGSRAPAALKIRNFQVLLPVSCFNQVLSYNRGLR